MALVISFVEDVPLPTKYVKITAHSFLTNSLSPSHLLSTLLSSTSSRPSSFTNHSERRILLLQLSAVNLTPSRLITSSFRWVFGTSIIHLLTQHRLSPTPPLLFPPTPLLLLLR